MPPREEKLLFGDIIEAGWLFDLYLREAARGLSLQTTPSGDRWVPNEGVSRERRGGVDYALAFSESAEKVFPAEDGDSASGNPSESQVLAFGHPRLAIVLTDDCETNKVIERGGRIVAAMLVPWPTNSNEVEALEKGTVAWRRFPLWPDPDSGFPGMVVDLWRQASIWYEALPHATRKLSLTEEEAASLSAQWSAHATRHGPVVSLDAMNRFVEASAPGSTFSARQETVKALSDPLVTAWKIEQEWINRMLDAIELHQPVQPFKEWLLQVLIELREQADAAVRAIESQ